MPPDPTDPRTGTTARPQPQLLQRVGRRHVLCNFPRHMAVNRRTNSENILDPMQTMVPRSEFLGASHTMGVELEGNRDCFRHVSIILLAKSRYQKTKQTQIRFNILIVSENKGCHSPRTRTTIM